MLRKRTGDQNSETSLAPKRMIIGPKSCAECRRRKVRCNFPLSSTTCTGCAQRGVECRPQERKTREPKPHQDQSSVRTRIEELEQTVRRLSVALGSREGSTSAEFDALFEQELRLPADLDATPSGTEVDTLDSSVRSPGFCSTIGTQMDTPALEADVSEMKDCLFKDAPLIGLFRDAMLAETDDVSMWAQASQNIAAETRLKGILQRFVPFIPAPNKLESILEVTEKYWAIWPPYSLSNTPDLRLEQGDPTTSTTILFNALASARSGLMAKTAAWIALCIQQLSRAMFDKICPPMSQADLIDLYLSFAKELIQEDEESRGSQDGFEAMNLLYKIYLNMGQPQRAWYWIRRGVLAGTSLGLHRKDSTQVHQSTMWLMTWMSERVLSVMLGLPSSVSSSCLGTGQDSSGLAPLDQLLWKLGTVAGYIVDRDQNRGILSYATTIRMSRELQEAQALFPAEWWSSPPAGLAIANLWNLQATKFLYFIILKHIHLPYMLKSIKEDKFRHSWDVAMDASRRATNVYNDLRSSSQGEPSLCRFQDFQAFCAAMVLSIGHLISPNRSDSLTKERDWAIVRDIELSLRYTANVLDCTVSEQAAKTLEVMKAARYGGYLSAEDYVVTIPYFGKLHINSEVVTNSFNADDLRDLVQRNPEQDKISQLMALGFDFSTIYPSMIADISVNQQPKSATSASTEGQTTVFNTIEFSTTDFSQECFMNLGYGKELGIDWTDLNLLEGEYGWTERFMSELAVMGQAPAIAED